MRIVVSKLDLEALDILPGDLAATLGISINDITVLDELFFINDYQEEAIKTMTFLDKSEVDKYTCMKLAEEVGELSGMVAKHYYHKKEFDHENLVEELGDIMWYVAALAKNNDVLLSEVCNYNINKLRKRHGKTYDSSYYNQELNSGNIGDKNGD